MLVASLLDVVGDQQHVGATSPHALRHEPQTAATPLKIEEPGHRDGRFTGFKTATVEELPDAVVVMDPFHVVRLAGDALDRCRSSS